MRPNYEPIPALQVTRLVTRFVVRFVLTAGDRLIIKSARVLIGIPFSTLFSF